MTPALVLGVYLHPRDSRGQLVFERPGNPVPDRREQVRRQCFRNGITDPKTVDRVYGEWVERQRRGAEAARDAFRRAAGG